MRPKIVGIVVIAFVFLTTTACMGAVVAIGLIQGVNATGGDHVAVIDVHGSMVSRGSGGLFGGEVASAEAIIDQLEAVRNDSSAKAVLLNIDSPGGSVVAAQSIHNELKRVQADGIPIVAYFGDTAASAAYYISTPADHIVSMPGTITGSLGVIASVPNMGELYEKIGIDVQIVKSGEFKDMLQPTREMTDEEREILESIIKENEDAFVDVIVKGRRLNEAEVRRLADGRIYSGEQALTEGLVDELGDFNQAVAKSGDLGGLGDDPRLVEYSDADSFADVFLGGVLKQLGVDIPLGFSTDDTFTQIRY